MSWNKNTNTNLISIIYIIYNKNCWLTSTKSFFGKNQLLVYENKFSICLKYKSNFNFRSSLSFQANPNLGTRQSFANTLDGLNPIVKGPSITLKETLVTTLRVFILSFSFIIHSQVFKGNIIVKNNSFGMHSFTIYLIELLKNTLCRNHSLH